MKAHLIYKPNGQGTEVRARKAGCRDISRDLRGCTSHYELEVASQREAGEKAFSIPISSRARTVCRMALPIGKGPNGGAIFAPAAITAKANGAGGHWCA